MEHVLEPYFEAFAAGAVARADDAVAASGNMSRLARKAGMSREGLQKALSGTGDAREDFRVDHVKETHGCRHGPKSGDGVYSDDESEDSSSRLAQCRLAQPGTAPMTVQACSSAARIPSACR